tara:strand:- start:732 stop:1739 length:1008 start_codon:yes stop_codon:yes gene_type:complete
MSTIYKKKLKNKSVYYGNFNIDGKRVRKRLSSDIKVAKAKLKLLELELLNPKKTVDIIFAYKMFCNQPYIKDLSKPSFVSIDKCMRMFVDFCNQRRKHTLRLITPQVAQEFIIHRSNMKIYKYGQMVTISDSTLNRNIGYLKRFFNFCIEMEYINRNPFMSIKNVRKKGVSQRFFFTDDHLSKIMKNAGKFKDLYTFLIETGIRATDVYNLKQKHISENYLIKKMNKTGDYLNVPLSRKALDIVQLRISEYIFPEVQVDSQKRKLNDNLKSNFNEEFLRKNQINLHTFRHTFAHKMLNKGVPKEILQTLLGHKSIQTTEIYANWVSNKELEKFIF